MDLTLDLYLNHLRHPAAIISGDGRILVKNSSFDTIFHSTSNNHENNLDEVFGRNPDLIDAVVRVTETKSSYFLRDAKILKSDGQALQADVEAFPLLTPDGEMTAVSLLLYDRTGRVSLEEHQKRIDRINYLGTIAVGLAHEIKNPLSGIKGASQLLAHSLKGHGEVREYAEIIQREVVRVDQLVKDLLNFTKPRKLNKKKININQILHDLVLLQRTIEPGRIQVLEAYDPSLPAIHGDAEALSQVFLNLIKNARQAIHRDGKITVRSRLVTDFVMRLNDKKHQVIGIDVEDTGEGIDPQALANIFVPFFTTKAKGTGLGLALCQQIIQEHEGNIQVKSEKGRGTTFSVYLPI